MTEAARRSLRLATDPDVRALQTRINQRMAALTSETVERLYPALLEVRRELTAALRTWMEGHPDSQSGYEGHRLGSLLVQLKAAEEAARDLAPAMGAALARAGQISGGYAARDLERQVALFSKKFGQPLLMDVDTAAVLASTRPLLAEKFASWAVRYGKASAEDVQKIRTALVMGTLRGETVMQMARRVSLTLPDAHPSPEGLAEGVWRRQMYRGERIARTEVMEAHAEQSAASIAQWAAESPGAQQMISETEDARVCVACEAVDGDIVPIGTTDLEHPQCRRVYVPWHAEWSATEQEESRYAA